jgi:hypothetical protein
MGLEETKLNIQYLAVLILTAVIGGCSIASPVIPMQMTDRKIIDMPELNTISSVNLGETLVAKGVRITGEALEVSEVVTFSRPSELDCDFSVQPETRFFRGRWQVGDEVADCFGPFTFQATQIDGSTNWNCPGKFFFGDVCLEKRSGDFFVSRNRKTWSLEQSSAPLVIFEGVVDSQTNFVQELIYNGRSGDTLKFIYRELADDMLRAAFTQDIQYDLSQSKEIGFKNVRIEVMEASNTSITYKVLSNF